MPRIDISERDLTQATGTVGTDIPYIPGFTTSESAPSYPVLCASISDFEALFGETPVVFSEDNDSYSIKSKDFDRSYIMAKELLAKGMPVYYHAIVKPSAVEKSTHPIETFTAALTNYLSKESDNGEGMLADKDEYTVKYLTSGGYHNYGTGIDTKLLNIAATRGDCVALIEDKQTQSLDPLSTNCFWNSLCSPTAISTEHDEFGAAFTPWAYYRPAKKYGELKEILMPACFGYLADLAVNIKTSPNWLAMAGTTRGIVPSISRTACSGRLSNTLANKYQPTKAAEGVNGGARAVNAITDIKPYGLTIWGNRTLKAIGEEGLTATNFLNTRNMISDIKKVAYRAAKAQLFEQNSETLWLNFKADVSPFLDQLKRGNGISDYKLLKLDTKYNGNSLGKEEFACAIKIYPLYAVESFEITVVVSDNDVAVG